MKALKYNQVQTVYLMLEKDQSLLHLHDSVGRTPLHFAVRRGFNMVVEILLCYNADIHAEDELGVTPMQLSEKLDNDDVYQLMLNK